MNSRNVTSLVVLAMQVPPMVVAITPEKWWQRWRVIYAGGLRIAVFVSKEAA